MNMAIRIIISMIMLFSAKFLCLAVDINNPVTASEKYIKNFQENFRSLPEDKQAEIISKITTTGKQFESVIDSADYYIHLRNIRIDSIRQRRALTDEEHFFLNHELIEEYLLCSFDSAFSIGSRNLDIAQNLKDSIKIVNAKIDLARIFIQGGYFREAAEQFDAIDTDNLDKKKKIEVLMSKFFLEFENGFFFAWNQQNHDVSGERMKSIYMELFQMLPDDAYELYKLKSAMSFYEHKYLEATGYYDILLLKIPDHGSKEYIHTLGDIGYNRLGAHDYAVAMEYMVKSATLAIRKGMINNPALRKIAELMFVVGNDKFASKLINKSMDDAMKYNSKYRIIESAKGYPMINRNLEKRVKRDHQIITVVAIVLGILIILLGISLFYSRKQHRELKKQKEIITNNNETLKKRNKEIESFNEKLSEIHGVTSVLVSKMMYGASVRRELVEKLGKEISLKIKVRQYDDIPKMIDVFKKEIKSLYLEVDEVLLAFFPNFIEQFNHLLKEECRVECKKGSMTTEIRIFALWRIGIKKNEDIARCMGYSLNTIKSYKTKIINASLYEKEEFYDRLMKIQINTEV